MSLTNTGVGLTPGSLDLDVARGLIPNIANITITGCVGIGASTSAALYTMQFGGSVTTGSRKNLIASGSPTTVKISSTSAGDTGAGTGVQQLTIQGLDANYNPISETVTMNGTTAVVSANSYQAVNKIFAAAVGSAGLSAGNIWCGTGTVTSGVPATKYRVIPTWQLSDMDGYYTVPNGYTLCIDDVKFTTITTPITVTGIPTFRVVSYNPTTGVGLEQMYDFAIANVVTENMKRNPSIVIPAQNTFELVWAQLGTGSTGNMLSEARGKLVKN